MEAIFYSFQYVTYECIGTRSAVGRGAQILIFLSGQLPMRRPNFLPAPTDRELAALGTQK